ncbi:hypothetical protein PRIPAC_89226 [Pristionchus pacificus]|uniref:Uncharacterized protein n=1 Tax=Pristionchus pacificus TaxID=54126 RepID=A0A2A6CX01_PRIPA|nr:hypothetical protein PRIPAC_89226 [Pristionchus pacificus]|eukprot:PDM82620.1 hypothetical protein PRIPAC_37013 [Pristionchus pacificus]
MNLLFLVAVCCCASAVTAEKYLQWEENSVFHPENPLHVPLNGTSAQFAERDKKLREKLSPEAREAFDKQREFNILIRKMPWLEGVKKKQEFWNALPASVLNEIKNFYTWP